jgi:hypothetical protein
MWAYPGGPTQWWTPIPMRQHFGIDWSTFIITMTVMDLFLDLVVLSLPWPIIAKLHMSTKKKIYVGIFFLLGAL